MNSELSTTLELLDDVVEITNEIEKRYTCVKGKISVIDKLIVELEHEIEFTNKDAIQQSTTYRLLKDTFRLRRYYKNIFDCLSTVRLSVNTTLSTKAMSDFVEKEEIHGKSRFKKRLKSDERERVLEEVVDYQKERQLLKDIKYLEDAGVIPKCY
jgi:hypothetical protein